MNSDKLVQIREAEKISHTKVYTDSKLYEEGSWLEKPIKTVLDIVPLFKGYQNLRILDLGSGVGRNCIPFAQAYSEIDCNIECIDILELAIRKLHENAKCFQVDSLIHGKVMPIEEYIIPENVFDLIMAISTLEHIESKKSFEKKLQEIKKGIRGNGIVCFVMNSNVIETDKKTGENVLPQFEVNFPTEELCALMKDTFRGWELMKTTVRTQQYDIPREKGIVELKTDVVTYVARKL